MSLSELGRDMLHYPQYMENVPTENKEDFQVDGDIQAEISRWENELGDSGRTLVRPSGTQDLIRVMVEGKDQGPQKKPSRNLLNSSTTS